MRMYAMWIAAAIAITGCGGGSKPAAKPEPAPSAAAPAAPSAPSAPKGSPEDAAKLNDEGKQLMFADKTDDARVKFTAAIAIDPKAIYAFNLCVADFTLGRFADAKQACKTAQAGNPEEALATKVTKMLEKIEVEAKKQGITLP